MNNKIIELARKKLSRFIKRYPNFINIGVDDWRGFRFIFDTKDVRQCNNQCNSCPLYQLLKREKEGLFSSTLYPASDEDKSFFGPQNYLNCKTLEQYQNCYVNWLINRTNTKKEIMEELGLVKNFKIIYSKSKRDLKRLENSFKQTVVKLAIEQANKRKACLIDICWKKL